MHSRLPQRRAYISALLICLQLLGLAHVSFGRHLVSDTGAIVDVAGLATEQHEEQGGHVCSDVVTLQAEGGEDCLVLSTWRAASLVAPHLAVSSTQAALVVELTGGWWVAAQLEILSRAPKASPPQG